VYKTLAVLKSTGEVLELEFSGDYNRYDGKMPGPHPHLMCIKCKRIVDPDYGRRVAEGLGLNIQEVKRLAGLSAEQRAAATAK
jgi:Fur family peroxide stress response transcriptional regulator